MTNTRSAAPTKTWMFSGSRLARVLRGHKRRKRAKPLRMPPTDPRNRCSPLLQGLPRCRANTCPLPRARGLSTQSSFACFHPTALGRFMHLGGRAGKGSAPRSAGISQRWQIHGPTFAWKSGGEYPRACLLRHRKLRGGCCGRQMRRACPPRVQTALPGLAAIARFKVRLCGEVSTAACSSDYVNGLWKVGKHVIHEEMAQTYGRRQGARDKKNRRVSCR